MVRTLLHFIILRYNHVDGEHNHIDGEYNDVDGERV